MTTFSTQAWLNGIVHPTNHRREASAALWDQYSSQPSREASRNESSLRPSPQGKTWQDSAISSPSAQPGLRFGVWWCKRRGRCLGRRRLWFLWLGCGWWCYICDGMEGWGDQLWFSSFLQNKRERGRNTVCKCRWCLKYYSCDIIIRYRKIKITKQYQL